MSSISSKPPNIHLHRNPISLHLLSSPSILSFSSYRSQTRLCALKTGPGNGGGIRSSSDQDAFGSDLLRKPALSPAVDTDDNKLATDSGGVSEDDERREDDGWVDWEDQILEDTVPLVGFVRMILHSGKYQSGDKLSPEHERTILERLLPYHPECDKKIGCGVEYITVGYHPNFESSRCLFIVRTDGEMVDFSYWKCIKGLIRKNYPLYADSFILRHFRRRRHAD